MAHWTDKHNKKDIVKMYESEIITIRAELRDEIELADKLASDMFMILNSAYCQCDWPSSIDEHAERRAK